MKTYTKEEARDLVYSGTHQIHNDCDSLDLLKEVVGSYLQNAAWRFYTCIDYSDNELIGRKVIRLSKIKDDEPKKMTFKFRDLQYKNNDGDWVNSVAMNANTIMRFKPDYSKEIEALEKKAAEYGEKVIINFKSI